MDTGSWRGAADCCLLLHLRQFGFRTHFVLRVLIFKELFLFVYEINKLSEKLAFHTLSSWEFLLFSDG